MGIRFSKARSGVTRTLECVPKGVDTIEEGVQIAKLSVQTFSKFAPYIASFHAFLSIAGVATAFLQVHQLAKIRAVLGDIKDEIAAQTSLQAQKLFASHVLEYIHMVVKRSSSEGKTHLFFLYHPDTDWHPRFFRLAQENPLPQGFCGVSENLFALCIWIRFLRFILCESTKTKKPAVEVVFHILMPAYRPFEIQQPLKFSEQLQPLRIHGSSHKGGQEYVKLNLCNADQIWRDGVGLCEPTWTSWLWPGEPRVLGHIPGGVADSENIFGEDRRSQGSSRRGRRRRRSARENS